MVKRRRSAALACALSAALMGASGADANVRTPTSGWEWGNPTPQGNTLRALGFVGGRGYAAGDFGTVLRTNDGGLTWAGLPSGVSASLNLLQVLGPDSFVVGGGCVVRRSDDGGTVFRRIYFVAPSCKEGVSALAFSSSAVGYLALADGTLLRTTDGGTSFARGTAVPGTRSSAQAGQATPTDLATLSDTTAFVATSSGEINVTTDGGGSWKAVIDVKRPVRDITFVDAKRGFAVGDGSLVLRTDDGGATWKPQALGTPDPIDLAAIRCVPGAAPETPPSCLAASRKGDVLVRTTDGADTFSIITPSTDPIFAADFASSARIVAGGNAGAVVLSDDGGLTFGRIGSRLPGTFSRLRSTTQGAAFAAGDDGALARSTNSGASWSRVDVPTSEALVDVAFASPTTGYALDSAGALFRTTNGGTGWSTLDTGTTAKPAAIAAPTDQRVLLFGPTGIRRSNDGGGSFTTVRGKAVAKTKLNGFDRAGSALFAYGYTALLRSTDGGATWTAIKDPGTPPRRGVKRRFGQRLLLADFADATHGFGRDSGGRMWRTDNGGRKWTQLLGIGTTMGSGMAFSSAKSGYVVLPSFRGQTGGYLMRTDDAGRTWAPQLVTQEPIGAFGIAAGGPVDYLLAGSASFLSTRSGGRFGDPSSLTIRADKTKLRKPVRIRISGKLSPARGNEEIAVSALIQGRWSTQTARAAANGSFTTSWNVRRGTNAFVAQWAGDDRSAGDGSTVLTVRVGR
ncbi:MAG: hypothetical protein QOI48_4307 [Solirubrobacteraceae bacterium]|nr:hypothetical protein [Solirubrobacteraceae bacterium]